MLLAIALAESGHALMVSWLGYPGGLLRDLLVGAVDRSGILFVGKGV